VSQRGRFITLEGVEGTGKTTQLPALAAALQARGVAVTTTREPGGTALGEAIRGLLLAPSAAPMQAETELLLLAAARAEHLACVIRPALAAGRWVLCDRYADASAAYQGAARGLGVERVDALHELLLPGWRPDRTLLLEAPDTVTTARRTGRGATDRFEAETAAFHARVARAYTARAVAEPGRFRRIDASGSEAQVLARLLAALADWLPSGPHP
jgi:dTMP kinase